MKRINVYLVALFMMLSAVFAINGLGSTASAAVDNTPDCDNVAIIKCGAFTEKGLLNKYDDNAYGDLPRVFNAFGISRADIAAGGFQNGIVWRDGRVTVGDKVVATNAMTAGRNYGGTHISGTHNVGKYSTSKFVTEGQTAFIKIVNGQFQFAIVKSCGNPVTAQPKVVKQPKASCDILAAEKISRTSFRFTAKASGSDGAKITGYTFNFGDGTTQNDANGTISHTYNEPGTYTIRATALATIDGKTVERTSANCVKKIVVEQPAPGNITVCEPETGKVITVSEDKKDSYKPVGDVACQMVKVCNPETGETITVTHANESNYKPVGDVACQPAVKGEGPQAIASTGPEMILSGFFGSGAIGYGAYSLVSSRRNLIRKLLSLK